MKQLSKKLRLAGNFLGLWAFPICNMASAADFVPLPPRVETIERQQVTFDGALRVELSNRCANANVDIRVGLDDLRAKLPLIARSAGLDRNEKCGAKVAIHGANLRRNGDGLSIKVNGNVGKQECIKTKVPEFRGLKVTMKTRVVASTTIRSNVSVEARFLPIIVNGGTGLSLKREGDPVVRISNDILRTLVRGLGLKSRLADKVGTALNQMLAKTKPFLLPDRVKDYNIKFQRAAIEEHDGSTYLVVSASGTVPAAEQPLLRTSILAVGGSCG